MLYIYSAVNYLAKKILGHAMASLCNTRCIHSLNIIYTTAYAFKTARATTYIWNTGIEKIHEYSHRNHTMAYLWYMSLYIYVTSAYALGWSPKLILTSQKNRFESNIVILFCAAPSLNSGAQNVLHSKRSHCCDWSISQSVLFSLNICHSVR